MSPTPEPPYPDRAVPSPEADADWLDGFEDLKALRDALRRQRAEGALDLPEPRDLAILKRWSDALAGLEGEALDHFVHETFVGLGLMEAGEAERLLAGLRLFRRREWNALPATTRARLDSHERLTAGIVKGFRDRLERALAIARGAEARGLGAELMETRSDRNRLIEIRGAIEFMNEVSATDPLLRMRLAEAARAVGGSGFLDRAIDERTIPAHRVATLIGRAVGAILETVVQLETANLKARHPRLYDTRRARATRALCGHLARARELGCAAAIRSLIIARLRDHPGVFEDYFGTPHPLR